jgi:hypothetical protein
MESYPQIHPDYPGHPVFFLLSTTANDFVNAETTVFVTHIG